MKGQLHTYRRQEGMLKMVFDTLAQGGFLAFLGKGLRPFGLGILSVLSSKLGKW